MHRKISKNIENKLILCFSSFKILFLNLKTALDFSRTIFGRFPNPIIFTERNRCVTRREKTQSTTHIVTAQVTICLSCGPYCFWV